jgi:hypothetical protein
MKREKKMKFDLSKYATVAERLAMFHKDYPDGRIITELVNEYETTLPRLWIFKTSVYLTAGDHAAGIPKATGYASEIDGTGGANNGSACENAESSSCGRGLMLAGYSASKNGSLASAQEMDKMNRIAETDWLAEAGSITDKAELRGLYIKAKSQGAPVEVLGRLKDIAAQLDDGEAEGTSGSLQLGKGRG